MDVRSFYDLGFQSFDIFYFYPEVSSHSLRSVHTFGISKEEGIFSIVSIEACQGNFSVFCLSCDRTRMAECQRIGDLWCFSCHGDRPWSAVLQKLTIFDIRMADGPVCKEASGISHSCCLYHQCGDRTVNVSFADNRDSFFVQK